MCIFHKLLKIIQKLKCIFLNNVKFLKEGGLYILYTGTVFCCCFLFSLRSQDLFLRAYLNFKMTPWVGQMTVSEQTEVSNKNFHSLNKIIFFYAPEAHIMYFTVSSSFLISFVMRGSGPRRVIKFLYSPERPEHKTTCA
jgi:hypothetical protein